jgi:hypothetical protein
MEPLQAKVKAVEAYEKSGPEARAKVDQAVKTKAIPGFYAHLRISDFCRIAGRARR